MSTETKKSQTSEDVRQEVKRIDALFADKRGADAEDVLSYAKEIVAQRAALNNAVTIIGALMEIRGDSPSELFRQAIVGIGSKTKDGHAVLRASTFLDRHRPRNKSEQDKEPEL